MSEHDVILLVVTAAFIMQLSGLLIGLVILGRQLREARTVSLTVARMVVQESGKLSEQIDRTR